MTHRTVSLPEYKYRQCRSALAGKFDQSQRKIDYTLLLIGTQALDKAGRMKTKDIKENVFVVEDFMVPAMVQFPRTVPGVGKALIPRSCYATAQARSHRLAILRLISKR